MRWAVILIALALTVPTVAAVIDTRATHEFYYNTVGVSEADVPGVHVPGACSDIDQDPATDDFIKDGNGDCMNYIPPFYECGVDESQLRVRIQNPFPLLPLASNGGEVDLDRSPVVSSSSFYVIPEVTGALAGNVEAIWFEFLETTPTGDMLTPDEACATDGSTAAVTQPGVYYAFYRGDTDPSDGWIIPINTLQVPDNIYGALLRVYGQPAAPVVGGTVLLATGVTYAIVDNYDGNEEDYRPSTPTNCQDQNLCPYQDHVPPWPSVVPGDIPVNGHSSYVIQWGETVESSSVSITVGSQSFSGLSLSPSDQEDVDGVAILTVSTDSWGNKVIVTPTGGLDCNDTVTVTAEDARGNTATKTVPGGSYCP